MASRLKGLILVPCEVSPQPPSKIFMRHKNGRGVLRQRQLASHFGGGFYLFFSHRSSSNSCKNLQLYQSHEPPISYKYSSQWQDADGESANSATVAAVDRVMKKYADSILLLLGNMSERTSQLESTTQQLEYSVQMLKASVTDSHGDTHGKLQVLENLLREVQTGVQVLRDKQEIVEHHSQLAKLQLKSDAPGNISSSSSTSEGPPKFVTQGNQPELSMKQPLSAPCQQQQIRSPPATIQQQQLPSLPPPAAYQQQQLPPLPQPQIPLGHQQQLQQSVPQQENLHQASLHRQSLPSAPQQHQVPPQYQPQPIHMQPQLQQHVPQGPGPLQQYNQQPDMPPFSSLPHGQHFQGAQQAPHYSASFSSETLPYMPSKYEPLSDRQSLTQYQSPPQTPHGPSGAQRYEPFPGKAPAQVPAPPPYLPHAQPVPAAPAYEPQPSMGYRVVQPSPAPSGGGGYPRLPTAQPVHTMANPSSSNGMPSGNRSSVDDVIEHVAGMGFSREQARAVVRRLKENGQSVDLNIVLDRLMNGGDSQPQKAWLGR
ncbi:hypothetical protein O6H91_07G103300 [Diphasiastrum complanatum]|uniref:Uncharacterized protein n=1 Tax=Diphasiastrum complanatum TaxID=34168 RepID=A0ACC2D938_DIPCM|nr:hypothetical protein O6H91_07G103300 [Diphasiastrum complanatum]